MVVGPGMVQGKDLDDPVVGALPHAHALIGTDGDGDRPSPASQPPRQAVFRRRDVLEVVNQNELVPVRADGIPELGVPLQGLVGQQHHVAPVHGVPGNEFLFVAVHYVGPLNPVRGDALARKPGLVEPVPVENPPGFAVDTLPVAFVASQEVEDEIEGLVPLPDRDCRRSSQHLRPSRPQQLQGKTLEVAGEEPLSGFILLEEERHSPPYIRSRRRCWG